MISRETSVSARQNRRGESVLRQECVPLPVVQSSLANIEENIVFSKNKMADV